MTYAARIVADSIAFGVRITTWELTFPRFILAEVNTHRMLSRNSASSRAIPVATRIGQVRDNPFIPKQFLKNRSGMQADETLDEIGNANARSVWVNAAAEACDSAECLVAVKVHKQHANRLLEPFAWHTALITATDTENLWNLRDHKDTQPEFQKIARMAREVLAVSTPSELRPGQWHLPYVDFMEPVEVDGEQKMLIDLDPDDDTPPWHAIKASVARCARISYERQNAWKAIQKDVARHDQMRTAGHMSPFEHQAQVVEPHLDGGGPTRRVWAPPFSPQYEMGEDGEWECFGYYCRNFRAPWLQYRATLRGERIFGGGR